MCWPLYIPQNQPALADETVHFTASTNPAAAAAPKSTVGATIAASGGSGDAGRYAGRILPSFSRPSRAVVTFALYRAPAREGTSDSLSSVSLVGPLQERRMYEVEALEHNTLQQVMGELGTPPYAPALCLLERSRFISAL